MQHIGVWTHVATCLAPVLNVPVNIWVPGHRKLSTLPATIGNRWSGDDVPAEGVRKPRQPLWWSRLHDMRVFELT